MATKIEGGKIRREEGDWRRLGKRRIGPTLGWKNLLLGFSIPNLGRAPRYGTYSFFNEIEPGDFVEEYRPDLPFSSAGASGPEEPADATESAPVVVEIQP
ncbi:MAG TPA: hypothetical protein PKH24_14270, partial [Sedimentisphaerales bacterium]|nr:hypothetical protein [Sedimentisphaerales bacterium]